MSTLDNLELQELVSRCKQILGKMPVGELTHGSWVRETTVGEIMMILETFDDDTRPETLTIYWKAPGYLLYYGTWFRETKPLPEGALASLRRGMLLDDLANV
jgi:hypothetical protein